MNKKYLKFLVLIILSILLTNSLSYAFFDEDGPFDLGPPPPGPFQGGQHRVRLRFWDTHQDCIDDLVAGSIYMGVGTSTLAGLTVSAFIMGKTIGEHYKRKKEQQKAQQKH